ncbi:hypothetical protein FOA22_24530 [Heyndrickxia oleronia]|uniref:hypothetical protein n=1 Tax=Heyndrickxia oleronia TaxID=38875 RepID=UPI00333B0CCD
MQRLEMYLKASEIGNEYLRNSKEDKEQVLKEIKNESLFQVTLRLHLYIERELNMILSEINLDYKNIHNNKFKTKLDTLYKLGIVDKNLYDVITRLNLIRNEFAHEIDNKEDGELYKKLLDGASGFVLENHKIDVKMKGLIEKKELPTSYKFKILLVNIWIHLKTISTNMNKVKLDIAKRLEDEVRKKIIELE